MVEIKNIIFMYIAIIWRSKLYYIIRNKIINFTLIKSIKKVRAIKELYWEYWNQIFG
jgi:hypothetical protein